MPLDPHDKEMVAIAASIAAGCRPCTTYHLREAVRAGVSQENIEKAVAGAVCIRNSATDGMRRHGLGMETPPVECGCGAADRLTELVALGAALAANCTANIEKHMIFAHQTGISDTEIGEVAAVATMIRGKAIDHAETAFYGLHPRQAARTEPAPAGCCGD